MTNTAKLFMNGRSQAVRLPINYRFNCDEVYIRKDEKTGDIILSKKPNNWEDFYSLVEDTSVPDDFMIDRDNEAIESRDIF